MKNQSLLSRKPRASATDIMQMAGIVSIGPKPLHDTYVHSHIGEKSHLFTDVSLPELARRRIRWPAGCPPAQDQNIPSLILSVVTGLPRRTRRQAQASLNPYAVHFSGSIKSGLTSIMILGR